MGNVNLDTLDINKAFNQNKDAPSSDGFHFSDAGVEFLVQNLDILLIVDQ